jgi:hypothetical protein
MMRTHACDLGQKRVAAVELLDKARRMTEFLRPSMTFPGSAHHDAFASALKGHARLVNCISPRKMGLLLRKMGLLLRKITVRRRNTTATRMEVPGSRTWGSRG